MKLEEWINESGKSRADFARDLKVSGAAVYRYVKGKQIPEREIMVRIYDLTGGSVGANDFYGLNNRENTTTSQGG